MNTISRHLLASAAYRFDKVVNEAPEDFPSFSLGHGTKTSLDLVNHIINVLSYADATLTETDCIQWRTDNWEEGIRQFHFVVQELENFLDNNEVEEELLQLLIQGPFSDLITGIGQLAMMRRLNGRPLKIENYMKAAVSLRPSGMVRLSSE